MSQNVNMEPMLHSGRAIIIAVGEEAIYRIKKTSLPHHIHVRIAVPIGKTKVPIYIYRKSTEKIIATGELNKINPLGKFCFEYVIHPWRNLRKHMEVKELDSDTIGWIIDAENGIAARLQAKPEPFKYLWVKPSEGILSDRNTVVDKKPQTLAPYIDRRSYV